MISFNDWLDKMHESEQRVPLISWGPSHEKVATWYAEHCVAEARNDCKTDQSRRIQQLEHDNAGLVDEQGRLKGIIEDLETDRDEWRRDAQAYALREDRDE